MLRLEFTCPNQGLAKSLSNKGTLAASWQQLQERKLLPSTETATKAINRWRWGIQNGLVTLKAV